MTDTMPAQTPNPASLGTTRRRSVLKGLAAGAAVALPASRVLAQSTRPLRIGCLNTFSRTFAVLGQNNLDGMNLWLEQNKGLAGGRKVEIIKEDDETNPQIGLQKLKKLVESDKVDMIVGVQGSNVAMALLDYVRANKVFWICSGAGSAAVTRTPMPNLFRTSVNNIQSSSVIAGWVRDNVGPEVICLASDFAGGRDTISEFKPFYDKRGGRISKELYPPVGTSDFSVYLAELQSGRVKGAYTFFAGSDAVRFVKQYAEYGLREQVRLACLGFMVESDTLPAQGESALGIVSALQYAETLDTPVNKAFVAAFKARYNAFPSVYSEYGYVTGEVIGRAMQALDGNTSHLDKLIEAVAAVSFEAPRGPFRFSPVSHNPIQNIYVREVAKIEGRLTNKVIATVAGVDDTKLTAA